MSTDSSGGAPQKKLTTAEILAKARAEKAAKAATDSAAQPVLSDSATSEPVASEAAPAAPAGAIPAAKPKSTADILAAARAAAAAKASGGEAAAPVSAPAAAAAKPKSTADILAAARAAAAAKAAGGEVVATGSAAVEGGAKSAPAAKSPVAAGGPKPSVQEMLAAVRAGQSPAPAAAAKEGVAKDAVVKVAAPPMPARPAAPAAKKAAVAETRRNFLATAAAAMLSPFWLAWASFAAAATASVLAVLRFMLPNVLTEPPSKFKVGPPGDYDLGTVSEKWKAQFGIWIVHTDKYQGKNLIYALSTVCTHLGCTPSWLDGEQKYKCPCHGSGFYINGINFEGPAPRPLERVGLRLAEDGMLEVDKSLKFQEEMGQWNDPASYVEIG